MIIHTRLLNGLLITYGVLLVYASLMPFDVTSNAAAVREFARIWKGWPFNPGARISGTDVITNLAVYFPLGWGIALRLRISRQRISSSVFVSTLICSSISAGVESLQLFLGSRICSASDWLLNSLSGFTGAASIAFCGIAPWTIIAKWLQNAWRTRPVGIAALVTAGLLAADALSPFLPAVSVRRILKNIQNSQLNLLDGFSLHPWHWWLVARMGTYAVLAMLLAGRTDRQKPACKEWKQVALMVLAFALCLEVGKLMVVSRTFNIANIAASLVGCGLGIIICRRFAGKIPARLTVELACVGVLFYTFYMAWTPFDFVRIMDISKRMDLSPVKLLPFYHYAMGAELNHVRLFAQSVLLMGAFTYLLRLRFARFEMRRSRIVIAMILAAAIGAIAECGQIFLLSRWPSMTDVYCFALGGGLGAWIEQPLSHQFSGPSECSRAAEG